MIYLGQYLNGLHYFYNTETKLIYPSKNKQRTHFPTWFRLGELPVHYAYFREQENMYIKIKLLLKVLDHD